MSERVRRLLKVRKGEGPQVFQFCLLSALLQAGLAIGMSATDALFLARVGPERLPVIYLLTPVVMLVYIPIYSYLTSRWGIDRLLDLTLLVLAAGGVVFCFILRHAPPVYFYAAKLYAGLWYIALYTLFWNFTENFYDIQDAKRLFPIFSGGASTGAMLGGGLVGIASRRLPVQHLFLAWALLALVALPLGVRLRRRGQRIAADESDEPRRFLEEVRETRRFVRQSPYVRVFAAVLFAALVLTAALEFQYSTVFSEGRSAAQLAALLGTLFAAVNGFNLLLNFFLFNRMVLTLGVGNVILITPLVYLGSFLFLLFHGGFGAGIWGFFAYQGILASVDWNNVNFLFNAVPAAARRQVRAVIEGVWEPVATAAAGGFLLLFATAQGYSLLTHRAAKEGVAFLAPEGISVLGLAVAVLYLLLAAVLRTNYLKSMVTNMKREWLDFSRPEAAVLIGLSRDELQRLSERTREDDEQARAALRILWLNDRRHGLERLLEYLARVDEAEREAAAPLLEMMLTEEEHESLRALLEWLDTHSGLLGPALQQVLARHGLIPPQEAAQRRQSPDPAERAAAVIASWDAWDLAERREAVAGAQALLKGSGEERAAAVRALGGSKQERSAPAVAACLQDPEPEVRREALSSLQRLATPDSSRLAPCLLWAIATGDAEERLLAIEALRKIADPGSFMPLLALSDRFSPAERRQAEALLYDAGLRSVPAAVAVLRDSRAAYPARSIAARALARIAFPQLESLSSALIHDELERAYRCLHFHQVLEREAEAMGIGQGSPRRHGDAESGRRLIDRHSGEEYSRSHSEFVQNPSVSPCLRGEPSAGLLVLSRYYRSQAGLVVDFVLELLTLGGRLPQFEQISAALRFGSRKERADALETIEQGAGRSLFRLLLPLIDGRAIEEQLRSYEARFRPEPVTPRQIVRAALESVSAVESAAAAQALWEAGDLDATSLLRARLKSNIGFWISDFGLSAVRETILSLLTRREDPAHEVSVEGRELPPIQHRNAQTQGPAPRFAPPPEFHNLVERLAVLARSRFFDPYSMAELEAVAAAARPVWFEKEEWVFRAGDPADAVFAVASGSVVLGRGVGEEIRQAGDVFGEGVLFGETVRSHSARAEEVCALRIPADAVSAAVRVHPRIGIGLLAEKMKVSCVA
jgi:hypothetical protein